MANRFSATEKWQDTWFLDLSPSAKILFLFLCDNCDLAGFYEKHDKTICYFTGISQDKLKDTFDELRKSTLVVNDVVWVKNFIRHQKNLPLNTINKAHKTIIFLLVYRSDSFGSYYQQVLDLSLETLRGLEGAWKGLVAPPDIDIDNGKGNGKGNGKDIKRVVKGGNSQVINNSIPTLEQVSAYCQERKNKVDPNRFIDFYSAKGWMIGKNKIKDWRAAVRTWEKREEPKFKSSVRTPAKIRILSMYASKISDSDIKAQLLTDGYTEHEIDEGMRR